MEYLDFVIPFFSSIAGGGGALFVGFKLFKQKTEMKADAQFEKITALVTAQKEANDLQAENNGLQQKKIDDTDKALSLVVLQQKINKEQHDKFEKEMVYKNGRTEKALSETAVAISGLDGTMKGLRVVLDLIIKRNGLDPSE